MTNRSRLMSAGVTTLVSVLAAGAGLAWWRSRSSPDTVSFHETGDLSILRLEREAYAAELPPEPPVPLSALGAPARPTYFLTETHATKLFGLGKGPRKYDPFTYYCSAPDRSHDMRWAEHPERGYVLETNSEGLRDTERDPDAVYDLRVLVAGDSHTFGICNLEETWPNRLEARLAETLPGRSIDVLNAAQGGFTLYHYLGTLEKFLEPRPDVFVVAVYAGNDFNELIQLRTVFEDVEPPARLTQDQIEERRAAVQINRNAMGQCFNSIWSMKARATIEDDAMETSVDLVRQMQAICERRGIRLVVALIPAPCDLAWEPPVKSFAELRAAMNLTEADCGVLDRMAERFLTGVDALGVTTVDMRPTYRAMSPPPYWRRDQHLDVRGHDELAAALEPIVSSWAVE